MDILFDMSKTSQQLNHITIAYFYSPAVNAAEEFIALIPKLLELGFGLSHTTVDVPPQRHIYKDSISDLEVPSGFQAATVNLKYNRENSSISIDPGRRLISFSGVTVDAAKFEEVNLLLMAAFPEPDSIPLTKDRQAELVTLVSGLKALRGQYEADITAREAESLRVDKAHNDAFSEINKTYQEHMKLKAPVDYWTARKTEMSKKAGFRLGFLCGGMMAMLGCLAMAYKGFSTFGEVSPPVWTFAFAAVALSLSVWALRMLATSYFSALHLAEDADFRAQMTKAYLALLSDGAATETDRHLVLQELFRPVSYGLLKHDGPPLGLIDTVRKLSGK